MHIDLDILKCEQSKRCLFFCATLYSCACALCRGVLKMVEILRLSLRQRGTVTCHSSDATVMHCLSAFSVLRFLPKTRWVLNPVHTGDKVEFNTVDFVESWQSWLCRLGPLHPGDKFERTFDIPTIELTTSAAKSTELPTSCRIQVVADLSPKPATKSTISATESTVLATVDFVTSVYQALQYDTIQ